MAANSQASRDFDEWCVRQFPFLPLPSRVMDLGSGTGKQTRLYGNLMSPNSEMVALDVAEQSLELLKDTYEGVAPLKTIRADFDQLDLHPNLETQSFDLIHAAYALYYTKNLPQTIRSLYKLLKPGGILWVIAPYHGTNKEFLDILRPLHEVEAFMDYVFDRFHRDVIRQGELVGFKELKPALFRNKVYFPDSEAFMKYLRNSLFYRPGHDEAIIEGVKKVCEAQGRFAVSKNVVSIQLRK